MGPLPGTKWDPSLGQTGLSLFNSTVKSLFCPVCPWDGWRFVPGTIVPQGPSEKCLCVFGLLVFLLPYKVESLHKFLARIGQHFLLCFPNNWKIESLPKFLPEIWTVFFSVFSVHLPFSAKCQTAKSTHHPHKTDDQHRECKTGGGAYLAFFLGSDNSHTTLLRPERPFAGVSLDPKSQKKKSVKKRVFGGLQKKPENTRQSPKKTSESPMLCVSCDFLGYFRGLFFFCRPPKRRF